MKLPRLKGLGTSFTLDSVVAQISAAKQLERDGGFTLDVGGKHRGFGRKQAEAPLSRPCRFAGTSRPAR
jgi:hypothetical protein